MANEDKPSHPFRNSHLWTSCFMIPMTWRHLTDNKGYTPKPISINSRWKIPCDTITHFTKIEIDCIYSFTLLLSTDLVALSKKAIKFVWHDLLCLNFCSIMSNIIIFVHFASAFRRSVNIHSTLLM